MAPYGITDAVIDFQQANPSYSVELIEGEGDTLKRMLLHEDIDLAFIRDSGAIEPEFKRFPLRPTGSWPSFRSTIRSPNVTPSR